MARPKVNHDGFLIPNAGDVPNPKMAEPDRIDFNTVGNDRWGVVKDCLVTVAGATASTLGGVAVVNGVLTEVKPGSALLGVGAGQDRFDLLVTDVNGTLKVIPGTPSTDPVFPDPGSEYTMLAAVFCPSGSASFVDYVIDKRNWLSDSLLTKIPTTNPLIRNLNGSGNHYQVLGDGKTSWEDDAFFFRTGFEALRLIRHLQIDGNLNVGGNVDASLINASGNITGANLIRGSILPVTAAPGDIFQHETSGRIYTWTNNHWEELATLAGAVPVGAIIQSLVGPEVMAPMGWVPLRGQAVQREQYPSLFDIPSLAPYIAGDTLLMPDATQRVLLSDFSNPGAIGGAAEVVLTPNNLPPHNHNIVMGNGGVHDHPVTINQAGAHSHVTSGGVHGHGVTDPTHTHGGGDVFGSPAAMICAVWGGRNKIDALFNDRSHTYSVEPVAWTARSVTGIQVNGTGSDHSHNVIADPGHSHLASTGPHNGHTHSLSVQSVGQGAPVDVRQPYLTVLTYIRS